MPMVGDPAARARLLVDRPVRRQRQRWTGLFLPPVLLNMQLREVEVDVRLRLLVGDDDAEDEIAFIDRLMEALRSDDASRAIARASCHLLGVEPVWQGLIGVREVARRLGVHENTVRNWARPGGVLHAARAGDGPPLRFRAADILP